MLKYVGSKWVPRIYATPTHPTQRTGSVSDKQKGVRPECTQSILLWAPPYHTIPYSHSWCLQVLVDRFSKLGQSSRSLLPSTLCVCSRTPNLPPTRRTKLMHNGCHQSRGGSLHLHGCRLQQLNGAVRTQPPGTRCVKPCKLWSHPSLEQLLGSLRLQADTGPQHRGAVPRASRSGKHTSWFEPQEIGRAILHTSVALDTRMPLCMTHGSTCTAP